MSNNGVHAFKQAFISRLVFTLLSAISNLLIPDHIPDAFLYKFSPKLPGDYFIQGFLGGLLRWDGHHYLSISQEGYTTESKFAFFPFYPFLMSFIGEIPLWCTAWFISQPYREILAGWIISTFFASASCAILYVSKGCFRAAVFCPYFSLISKLSQQFGQDSMYCLVI
jgi:hypothetical protein